MTRPPFPAREQPLGPDGLFVQPYLVWFRGMNDDVSSASRRVTAPLGLTAQSASIGTTPLPTDTLAPGLYRVSVYAKVQTAAATSSSLTVTLTWTDSGDSVSLSAPAMTGNTVTTAMSYAWPLIRIDQATPISYSTVYASNGAGEMVYDLVFLLEIVAVS